MRLAPASSIPRDCSVLNPEDSSLPRESPAVKTDSSRSPPRAQVGDVIAPRTDTKVSSTPALPREFGVISEIRAEKAKVFFQSLFGETWVPLKRLSRARDPLQSLKVPAWLRRMHFLCKALRATSFEIERMSVEGIAVRFFHRQIEITELDRIRSAMGSEIRYYALAPAGMRTIESSIAFSVEDGRAGEGWTASARQALADLESDRDDAAETE